MVVYIAADHGGFEFKNFLIRELKKFKYKIEDCGAFLHDPDDDYPDLIRGTIEKVAEDSRALGILCCRSGIGMSIMANRHPKIRAALCFNQDITRKARQHNNANILCLSGDYIQKKEALEMVKIFLNTKFEGGRHQRRLKKIERYQPKVD